MPTICMRGITPKLNWILKVRNKLLRKTLPCGDNNEVNSENRKRKILGKGGCSLGCQHLLNGAQQIIDQVLPSLVTLSYPPSPILILLILIFASDSSAIPTASWFLINSLNLSGNLFNILPNFSGKTIESCNMQKQLNIQNFFANSFKQSIYWRKHFICLVLRVKTPDGTIVRVKRYKIFKNRKIRIVALECNIARLWNEYDIIMSWCVDIWKRYLWKIYHDADMDIRAGNEAWQVEEGVDTIQ